MAKKRKPLTPYKGDLDSDGIAAGMKAAVENGKRLLQDAEFLMQRQRWPAATQLAVLAIEEFGKESVLRLLSTAGDEKSRQRAWRDYRSHTAKNRMWMVPDIVRDGGRVFDDFAPLFDEESDHPEVLDAIKQAATYTDCYGEARWSNPLTDIGESVARTVMGIAIKLVPKRIMTGPEIEIWQRELKGARTDVEMRAAALRAYEELERAGFDWNPKEARAFLYQGPRGE